MGEPLELTGTWAQVGDGKGGETGRGMAATGSREELLGDSQKGRESQTSGGGRRVGLPSRWIVAPCLGELGDRGGCKEISKRRQRVKYGEAIGFRSGGEKTAIQNTVETGGAVGGYNKLV